jgi:hypothetical protein
MSDSQQGEIIMERLRPRVIALIVAAVAAVTLFAISPPTASAETTSRVCTPRACILVFRTGNYVRQATVYLQDTHYNVVFDYHYYGPGGTPNRWARNLICNGLCAYTFTNINTTYQSGRLVCGEVWDHGTLVGRPCVTI